MGNKKIGTPTMRGFKDSMIDYAVGLGGGLGYSVVSGIAGSGLIGGLLTAGVVGSVVKGERGTVLSTMMGFQSIVGNGGSSSPAPANTNEGVL